MYLKDDILKLTDHAITFSFSGLQADELKKYLPAGEKICEFVYDEREKAHTFKTVFHFSNTEFRAECGPMNTYQKVGQRVKSDDVMYNTFGNTNTEIDVSGASKNKPFSIEAKFSKSGFSANLENMKAYNKTGQNVKPEEVRYIILGNKTSDSEFRKLKELCRNVNWIHVEEVSFLWRDTNVLLLLSAGVLTTQNLRRMT